MENVNSVCFVGKIEQINPIEGADKIVQAIISGWECVIQKDKHKVGDLVVIATADAVIPLKMAQELGVETYLKNRKKTNQLTVKTTKLKGVYSSALIISDAVFRGVKGSEGEDFMEFLGIEKYEEPAVELQVAGGKKVRYHKNPNFHVYHKFPNAKNAPDMFTEEDDIIITNKTHGTNARYGVVKKSNQSWFDTIKRWFGNKWTDYDFVYGSHNVEKGSDSQGFYTEDVWREMIERYNIKENLWKMARDLGKENLGEGIIIYGEIYGEGIQKYYDYGISGRDMKLFDIKLNNRYLHYEAFEEIAYSLGIPLNDPSAPAILYRGKFNKEIVEKLQHNRFILNTKVPQEGVIVQAESGERDKIAKFVNPAYLEFQSKHEDSTDFH